jgi:hypothetical protein
MTRGVLRVSLKGSKIEVEEPQNFIEKFKAFFLGKGEVVKEDITQYQYLQQICEVFQCVGMQNILALELNGKELYYDEENTPDDLKKAISIALESPEEEGFHARIEMCPSDKDDDSSIVVNMYSAHDVGEFPLVVDADFGVSVMESKEFLTKVDAKLREKFLVSESEFDLDEDDSDGENSEEEETPEEETSEEGKEE